MALTEPTLHQRRLGILGGFGAAVLYTASNIALRRSISADPMLVTAMKAIPTVLGLTPWLIWMFYRRPSEGILGPIGDVHLVRFLGVCLIGQVIGNGAFQIALGTIGLAAAVPMTLGALLIGGAVVGWVVLGERIGPRTVAAMIILLSAAVVLSRSNSGPVSGDADAQWTRSLIGAAAAVASGLAYAVFSSVMRATMRRGMRQSTAMWLSGFLGSIALWSIAISRVPVTAWGEIPMTVWGSMLAGGVFNFFAFIAMSTGLKFLPVIAVLLINGSQIAMASTAGVVLFGERPTTTLVMGVLMTFAGLGVLMSRPVRQPSAGRSTCSVPPQKWGAGGHRLNWAAGMTDTVGTTRTGPRRYPVLRPAMPRSSSPHDPLPHPTESTSTTTSRLDRSTATGPRGSRGGPFPCWAR